MAERDDRLLLRRLVDLRGQIDRNGADQADLRELVGLLAQEVAVEQSFRRRHEVKLAEVETMLKRILRRLELADDDARD